MSPIFRCNYLIIKIVTEDINNILYSAFLTLKVALGKARQLCLYSTLQCHEHAQNKTAQNKTAQHKVNNRKNSTHCYLVYTLVFYVIAELLGGEGIEPGTSYAWFPVSFGIFFFLRSDLVWPVYIVFIWNLYKYLFFSPVYFRVCV